MQWFGEIWRRLLFVFQQRRFDRDLEEEMQFHLEMSGRDAGPAVARRQFGNATLLKEDCRQAWGWRWLEDLLQDLRYTVVTFRRSPGFAITATLILALGIGANAAIFSVLYATCLADLPFAEPDRLVDVSMKQTTGRLFEGGTSLPNLRDWQNTTGSFEGLAMHQHELFVNLTGHGEAEEAQAWRLSSQLVPLLGVHPVIGRGFTAAEDAASGPHSALLSYGLWQDRFGGRTDVLGRSVFVDGEGFQIVGVLPQRFEFPPMRGSWRPVIWLSLNLRADTANARDSHSLSVVGRLKRGVSVAQAQSEMNAVARRLAAAYPKENGEWPAATVTLLSEQHIQEFRSVLWMLSGAAGLVLLIACANVAGLLLARGAAREQEFAIRRALGVSKGRLVRQLLTESCVLATVGGAAGILLAHWTLPLLKPLLEGRPRVDEIAIRPAVLAFTAALAMLTGVAFGLIPALRSAVSLRAASARSRVRQTLVAAEVALALLLMTGAGLLMESFWRVTHVDLGFRPQHLLTMRVNLIKRKYDSGRKVEAFREEWLRRVASLPGVEFAGTNSAPPMGVLGAGTGVEREGASAKDPDTQNSNFANVSTSYLQAMGIPLLRGRNFQPTDRPGSARVAILSDSVARRVFQDEEPLGKRVRLDRLNNGGWFTVVGIAGNVRQDRPETEASGAVYVLAAQLPEPEQGNRASRVIVMAIRTIADPHALAGASRMAAVEIDKDQPVADVITMSEMVDKRLASRRLNTLLLGLFAALALGLALAGVFGLVSYSVARRTHEIGIRMALGARRTSIVGMIISEILKIGTAGVVFGILSSLAASRLLAGMLYQVKPMEFHIMAGAAGLLVAAVLLATLFAARRAMNVDPAIALRHD